MFFITHVLSSYFGISGRTTRKWIDWNTCILYVCACDLSTSVVALVTMETDIFRDIWSVDAYRNCQVCLKMDSMPDMYGHFYEQKLLNPLFRLGHRLRYPCKRVNVITHPCPIAVRRRMCSYIPQKTMDAITYPCHDICYCYCDTFLVFSIIILNSSRLWLIWCRFLQSTSLTADAFSELKSRRIQGMETLYVFPTLCEAS